MILDKIEAFRSSDAYHNLTKKYDEATLYLRTSGDKIYICSKSDAFIQEPDMSIRTSKWFDIIQGAFQIDSLKKEIAPGIILLVSETTQGRKLFSHPSYFKLDPKEIEKTENELAKSLKRAGMCEELIVKVRRSFRAGPEMKRCLEGLEKKRIKDMVI
jgi:hypothetical protein